MNFTSLDDANFVGIRRSIFFYVGAFSFLWLGDRTIKVPLVFKNNCSMDDCAVYVTADQAAIYFLAILVYLAVRFWNEAGIERALVESRKSEVTKAGDFDVKALARDLKSFNQEVASLQMSQDESGSIEIGTRRAEEVRKSLMSIKFPQDGTELGNLLNKFDLSVADVLSEDIVDAESKLKDIVAALDRVETDIQDCRENLQNSLLLSKRVKDILTLLEGQAQDVAKYLSRHNEHRDFRFRYLDLSIPLLVLLFGISLTLWELDLPVLIANHIEEIRNASNVGQAADNPVQ